jgi:hypothetical protein
MEAKGAISFDDIEPKYLALYIGVAYSHSSMLSLTAPPPAANPEAGGSAFKTPLKDYVEVFKLCDRFVSEKLMTIINQYLYVAIGDRHRAMCRASGDDHRHKTMMRDFADGYEALEMLHATQKKMGETLIDYFCEAINYRAWATGTVDIMDKPIFIAAVSNAFARKLADLQATKKVKRRELNNP